MRREDLSYAIGTYNTVAEDVKKFKEEREGNARYAALFDISIRKEKQNYTRTDDVSSCVDGSCSAHRFGMEVLLLER